MAIVSKKTFLNTNQKNQQKAASTQQSGIANRADFVAGASGGNSEMQRRKTAFENYKKAVEAQRQVQAANAQRQQLLAGEARSDAMRDAAQAYSQSGYGQAAQQAAYENYTYALKQQELRQKQMRGQMLTPAEQKILNTNVYKDVGAAQDNDMNRDKTGELEQQIKELEAEINADVAEQEKNASVWSDLGKAQDTTLPGILKNAEADKSDLGEKRRELEDLNEQLNVERNRQVIKTAKRTVGALDEETQALLREYNAGSMYTRDYSRKNGGSGLSKVEARADLRAKGYSEDEIKSLAEYEQRLRDYENAAIQAEQSYQFGQEHPVISTVASSLMAPFKAIGNVESLRGVLPRGFGGYQNEDMPTNIYSPLYGASRASGNIRSGVMEDMDSVGQFLYQAGTSALDSAINMAASIGLVGAAGLGTGAAAQGAVANTMNWVMGSEVAADSVYEGIQNGKSNVDALIDGIVEGAIEGITEKYSVGDIIETMLSGKAAWRKVVRAFASEGAEEIASNWLNRIYDVTAKRGRGEVETAYRAYLAKGMSERDAMAAMVKDFAQEDGLSFLAGGLSGWAMSGTYAALGKGASEANIQWTAAQAIQRGEVQDVIDLGLAQGEGAAFDRAAALQGDLMRGAEPTQKDVAGVLREYVKEQRDAAEEAQNGEQTQEERTYQNFKSAVQDVEQSQAAYEQAQRQQEQQGVDMYDEDGSLLDVGDGWAEVDPEQYAGRQAAQAEAEMGEAAAAADNAYLEQQVQKNGYDDLTAAYFVNGNTTDLSVEEYAGKFQKVYERGQMGVSKEWALAAATGMNRDVATAAWEAGRKAAQQSAQTQYSISKDYRQKLRQWNRDGKPDGASFELGTTGATLQGLGAVESDIYMNGDKIKTILKEHPEITLREVERIPEILEDPVLILKSKTGRGDNSRLVLFGSVKAQNGQPMMAVLDLRATEDGFLLDDMQKVNSAYTKKNPASFIQSSEVLYADQKRTIPLLRQTGLTIASQPLLRNGSIGSISYEGKNVNLKGVPFGEVVQAERQGGNNGKNISAEGQERNAGARAGEQAQRVEQAAGGRSESARRGRERADQARNLSKTWPQVTNAELLGEDGSESTVRVMPRAEILKNADAKKAAEFFRTAGIKSYQFVVGQLETTADGRTFRADGVTLADGTVLVRLDSEEYSATQLAKHEGYHIIAQRNAEMAQRIRKRLVAEGKISKAQIDSYIDAYNAIYGDNTDAYVEEIVADAYAGINRTAYGTNNIRAEVTMEAGQWTKKTGSARAPPESRYSSGEQYDYTKKFADQIDDWKAGKIVKNDTLIVGPTPDVFQQIGFNALPVTINQTHVDYALNGTKNEEHRIGESMLKQLPRAMQTPVAVIASETQGKSSVVALLPFIKDAKTVIIPVYVDGFGRQNSVVIDSNAITSIYGRKNAITKLLTNAIEAHNNGETTLFYLDKTKATALYQVARVTMPKMPDTNNGFVASIRDAGSNVKPKLQNVTESQQFKRWFGDWQNHPERASKVVNADGTPKIMYRGGNETFNIFDRKKSKYSNLYGRGFYFTDSESHARQYGDVRAYYLDVKNPVSTQEKTITKKQMRNFLEAVAENEDYGLENYGYGATVDSVLKDVYGKNDFSMLYDVNQTAIGDMVAAVELFNEVNGTDYDGLILDTETVVFNGNQIKSATDNVGTFDRNNPDIRFSASAEQISEQDRENLNKVLEMMDAEGDGIFRDAVLLRNPKMLQKLVAERGKTESAAFTRWFGNSKAVNRNGEPLLVFHGAGARFTTFDAGGKPIWLTANIQYAEKYSTANRAAEKLLPSSSIYAGNVDRVIPAYIRVENPANVGDTDGGFDGNYMDLAKRIGVRPSELRQAWEEAGRPEMLWQVVNSKQISELLKRHGYDGIQAIENGVATWAVLEPTQIKSAVANNGAFSLKSADIRYASAQQRFRDALPERAAEYVARTENTLVRRLADNLSVPETAKRETLRPIADEIIYDVLRGGEMDSAKLNQLFEQAWDAGREADTEYYEQYKDVRDKIRTQKLFISAKDRADIADFNLFRKQTMGTLRLSSDGLPVDTFYQEMRDMAPELFPASITAPSDQLLQLYEVAQSIQKREKTLNEAFGAQAESFKTWARNDFNESVQRLAEGIRIAKRYQEAQERKKEKLGVPQTAEEAMELAKEVKAEKKKFQKVQSRYLLTDADQKVVNMLLRGDTTPEAVQNRENAEAILKTYEAKADYDLLALRLKAWNNTHKQGLRDQAENALNAAEAEKWVDKGSGLAYMRETMERNIRDIAKKGKVADEKAETFNNEYFYPVHKNESDRKSYVVGLQDRIKALNLSRKVEKGNLVSESYAVQWLGEAEFNRDYLAEHPRVKQRGGFGYAEWNAAIQKFHEENPRLDYAKIENAVKEFRSVYDQLYQDMNRVRMENGYEPVDYMQGYFPHFQENDQDGSLLTRFGRHLGITDEVTPLPTTINGLTQSFRPGIRYMANIQQRLGYATAYDALQGFDRYIEVASDVIYHTGDIQRLRALATQIRYRASDEGVRKQIDRILQDPTLTPDEANERVAQAMKDAPFALSNFVSELDEYTNLLAGKKSRLDRGMEKMLGRKFYNVCKAFESRVGANMVAANIGSALTNFIPLTQAWSQVSSADMLHGMWQTLQNYKTADGLDAASTFIHNRSGYGRLAMSTMDKVSEKAAFLMEAVDGFTTGSVVRARYLQNLRLGMSEVNAMQEADQFAANIMADRSKGATPTIYSARNPIIKLFTQFQLEVNNELSWIFKDMIPQERKKGVAQLAKALFKFLIGAWLYNEVYEAIVGRRAALDPLDILNDSVGDFTGYQLPNTVQSALSGRWDFTKEKPGTYQAIKNLGGNLVSELPGTQMLTALGLDEKWGLEIDSGRIAVSSAVPNFGNIEKALLASNEDIAPKKKVQTVINELANPAAYLALPFGGGQIKKMAQGAQAVMQGGSYKADNEGRDILQYPIYNDKPGEMAKNLAQALLFGKTATEEAQGWIESGFKNLSAKETAAYQEMTAAGADQRDSYTFVGAMKKLDSKEAKLTMLFAYDLPEEGKTAYYYNALADDTERGKMDALEEQGVSHSDYVAFRKAYFGAYGTQSVSQERVNTALDQLDIPKAEKAAIWRSCNKDWKEENNPYK